MTVKELKEYIEDKPDDMPIVVMSRQYDLFDVPDYDIATTAYLDTQAIYTDHRKVKIKEFVNVIKIVY